MSCKVIKVGVVGAGTVGSGTIETLIKRADILKKRCGVRIELAAVAELDAAKAIAAGASKDIIVDDYKKVTENPEIDIVAELIGGTGLAGAIVESALSNGKAVVTANKALLSEKGRPLFALAREKKVPLAFEAAVGGGIPCMLSIREGLNCNSYQSLLGILNGTCNYILTQMTQKGVAYETCLKEAQELGFAEADPTTDVGGFDTGHKLALLSALAFDSWVDFDKMHIEGIDKVDLDDVKFAEKLGYTIKLLAVARPDGDGLFLSVHPALLPNSHTLAGIHGSLNAVSLFGDIVQESVLVGRGAGKFPTASAVIADITQVARMLAFSPEMPSWTPEPEPVYKLLPMSDYTSRYYLRFVVEDETGVLAKITGALGDNNVSIASVNQGENPIGKNAAIMVITHKAKEGDIQKALSAIGGMSFTRQAPVLLRIEE